MDWSSIINQAMSRNNWTQPQLAEQVGCSQASISNLKCGKTLDPRYSVGSKLLELAHPKAHPQAAGEAGHA